MSNDSTDSASLVRGFLESQGFNIQDSQPDLVVADRLAAEREILTVWTLPAKETFASYESRLRARISQVRPRYPEARGYVLASSLLGLSRDFQRSLSEEGIRPLVPVWFFDTPFKVEHQTERTKSAINDAREDGEKFLEIRVPQPYTEDGRDAGASDEKDLFEVLLHDLRRAEGPKIRLVVGRAGSGKSVLAGGLFARLYRALRGARPCRSLVPASGPLLRRLQRLLPAGLPLRGGVPSTDPL
jgi:hypothetical protein